MIASDNNKTISSNIDLHIPLANPSDGNMHIDNIKFPLGEGVVSSDDIRVGFAMKKPVITYSNSALLEIMGDSEWACSDINDLKEKTIKMSTLSATERQEIGERNYKEYTANKSEIYHNQVMDIYKKYAPTLEVVTTST